MREERFPEMILTGHPSDEEKDLNGIAAEEQRHQTRPPVRGKTHSDYELCLNTVNLKHNMSVFLLT